MAKYSWLEERKQQAKADKQQAQRSLYAPSARDRFSMYTGAGEDGVVQPTMPTHVLNTNRGQRTLDEGEILNVDKKSGQYDVIPADQVGGQQALLGVAGRMGMPRYYTGKPGDIGYTRPGPKIGVGTDQQGLKPGDMGYTRTGPQSDAAFLLDAQLTGSGTVAGRAPDQVQTIVDNPGPTQGAAAAPQTVTYDATQGPVQTIVDNPAVQGPAPAPMTVTLDPNYQPTQTYDIPLVTGGDAVAAPNTVTYQAPTPPPVAGATAPGATSAMSMLRRQALLGSDANRIAGRQASEDLVGRQGVERAVLNQQLAMGGLPEGSAQALLARQRAEQTGDLNQVETQYGIQGVQGQEAAQRQLPQEERAQNDADWQDFQNAAEYGSDAEVAAAYQKVFGKPMDPGAAVNDIRNFAKTQRSQQILSGDLQNMAGLLNINTNTMSAVARDIGNGVSKDEINSRYGTNLTDADYGKIKQYGAAGNQDYTRGASIASTALSNGDYTGFNTWAAQNGLPAIDFSKAEANEVRGVAGDVLGLIQNLPADADPKMVASLASVYTGLMSKAWGLEGVQVGGADFQDTIDQVLTPGDDATTGKPWVEFTKWADTEIGSWIDSTEGMNFISDLGSNTQTEGFGRLADEVAQNGESPAANDIAATMGFGSADAALEEMGAVSGAYWSMLHNSANMSDSQRTLLKKYGMYDQSKDLGYQANVTDVKARVTESLNSGNWNYADLSAADKALLPEAEFNKLADDVAKTTAASIISGDVPRPGTIPVGSALYKALSSNSNVKSSIGSRQDALRGLTPSKERIYFSGFETYNEKGKFTEVEKGTIFNIGGKIYAYDGKQVDTNSPLNDPTKYYLVDVATGKRYYVEADRTNGMSVKTPTAA